VPAIIALVLIGVAIYLYYLLVRFLLKIGMQAMGPAMVVLLAPVPLIYGRTLLRVFGRSGWRNGFLVPAVALLVLVYADFAYVVLDAFARLTRSPVTDALVSVGRQVVWLGHVNREILGVLDGWIPVSWPAWAFVLLSGAAKVSAIPPLALLSRGLETRVSDGGQPARVQYFYSTAFHDLRDMTLWAWKDLYAILFRAVEGLRLAVNGPHALVTWPLALLAAAALLPPVAAGTLLLTMLLLFHGLTLGAIWVLARGLSLMLLALERSVMLARAGYAKCPHAGCHRPVPLPVFACANPDCQHQHDRLLPGRYGVFRRGCDCDRASLPTLFWLGKGRLRSFCPHCRQEMHAALFGGSVHIPVYGGPSAGKTMFMMAATWQVVERQLDGVEGALIDPRDADRYERSWKPDFEAGRLREKTIDQPPAAFLLSVLRNGGLPVSLYLYDPAGEQLRDGDKLEGHRFLEYFDGLALLVDPLSLRDFEERYRAAGGPDLRATTSEDDPTEIVTRVVNALESQAGLDRRRRFGRRLAVIISKSDIPLLCGELGMEVDATTPRGDWSRLGADSSERIGAWLRRTAPELHHQLETRFGDIRYFAASSLGRVPDGSEPFSPRQVLDPLCWLLARRQVLARPRLARVGGRALEVAAAAGVALLFLGLPVGMIGRWVVPPVSREAMEWKASVAAGRSAVAPSRPAELEPDSVPLFIPP
jgi:hypothetical protein